METVWCQRWEESERGWGERPDGYSLHATMTDLKEYIKEYWESMPEETPEEYSRPEGLPYIAEVDGPLYEMVRITGCVRAYGYSQPPKAAPVNAKRREATVEGNWLVEQTEDGWEIRDAFGQLQAKLKDAETLATHLAMVMQENAKLREELATIKTALAIVKGLGTIDPPFGQ